MSIALDLAHDLLTEREITVRTTRLATGIRMNYVDTGDGPQLPLVLIHGYTDSWFSWSRVIHELAVARRVVAVDLRGHGGSSRPAEGYAMATHADDIFALMNTLGIPRAVVIGHSMGSFVARRMAGMDPTRVPGLVLVGTGESPITPATRELEQAVAALGDDVPWSFVQSFQYSCIHRPVPATFMDRVIATSQAVPVHVWQAALPGMMAANDPIPRDVPTMIIWGNRDPIFSEKAQHELCASSPRAVLEVYDETGHTPHWERPERFVMDVERFCAQL